MIIAAAEPEAGAFLQFWVIIAFLAGIAANIVTVLMVARRQKREVSFTFEPASKVEFERHIENNRQEHAQMFAKIGGIERGANEKIERLNEILMERLDAKFTEAARQDRESREKIHDRINQVLAAVSRLEGRLNNLTME